MFILTYSSPTTGEVTELFATREAADAEAADVRHAMDAVGYGAYSGDCVRVRDAADLSDDELGDLPDDVQARIVAAEWAENDRRIAAGRMITGGDDDHGYFIYDSFTGERALDRGAYIQGFACRADADAFIAEQS